MSDTQQPPEKDMFSGSSQESMSAIREAAEKINDYGTIPEGEGLIKNVEGRQTKASIWKNVFFFATIFGLFVLATLLYTIVDDAFGLIAVQVAIEEKTIAAPFGKTELEELTQEEMAKVLTDATGSSGALRRMNREMPFAERDQAELEDIIRVEILKEEVVQSFAFTDSLFNRATIEAEVAEKFPRAELLWHSWISWDFLTTPMNSTPALAGIRTGILGTLWVTIIAMLFAIPLGVGAAIYLEEYATDTKNPLLIRFNSLVQTNINNLAGVPSIIFGLFGLALFVQALNLGTSLMSAGLTLGLLTLPYMITTAEEALKTVPRSMREGTMALGATQFETIRDIVLPAATPGIATGVVLSLSRAAGETAPILFTGAAFYITGLPGHPLQEFMALPYHLYTLSTQHHDILGVRPLAYATAAVLILLVFALNLSAIVIRERARRNKKF